MNRLKFESGRGRFFQALAMPFALPGRLHMRGDLHLARKVWHMSTGLFVVSVYMLTPITRSQGVLALGAVLAVNLLVETLRLQVPAINERVLRLWGPLMRNSEVDRLSGVPYYVLASLVVVAVFPKPVAILSILHLAFGDPLASLIGILYGDRSRRLPGGKSVIGTVAGVVTCWITTFIFLRSQGFVDPVHLTVISTVGGIAGGTAELLPVDVDDNLTIPIVSAFALWTTFIALGV